MIVQIMFYTIMVLQILIYGSSFPRSQVAADSFPEDCGRRKSIRSGKIIGGTFAKEGQFPWMARIGWVEPPYSTAFVCGGSLITERYVLTAAHCVADNMDKFLPPYGIVHLGQTDMTREPFGKMQHIPTLRAIVHEKYGKCEVLVGVCNDIALIELKRKAEFTDYVSPVCLPPPYFTSTLQSGTTLETSGFGMEDVTGKQSSEKLRYTQETLLDLELCPIGIFRGSSQDILCSQGVDNSGTCFGDSGGPLVTHDDLTGRVVQIGITSFGVVIGDSTHHLPCDTSQPSYNTNVSYFMDWIEEKVQ